MPDINRVAAIHDISGFGKCSLTIVIPVLSAMGIEVCPLPTALLSSHTGFKDYTFFDLSEEMEKISAHWKDMNIKFNCIYSGFLGSDKQVDFLLSFIKYFGNSALKVVDPVMGDNGRLYSTITDNMCKKMSILVKTADIITPNLTEACILLNEPYPHKNIEETTIFKWLERLSDEGPRFTIITGIVKDDKLCNYAYDKRLNKYHVSKSPSLPIEISGTGDLFTSVLTGALLNGLPLFVALEESTYFVYTSLRTTMDSGRKESDGIIFEKNLCALCANINRGK